MAKDPFERGFPADLPAKDLPVTRLEYLRSYRFAFDSPNGFMNVLWGALAQLSSSVIPIVGPLAYLGYQYEVIESLHRDPRRIYPDFNINQFVQYLGRGVWPFLVALVASLVIGVPIGVFFMVVFYGGLIGAAVVGQDGNEALAATIAISAVGLSFLGLIFMSLLANILIFPMILRAGLAQDFGEAFNFGWVRDFIRRMWWDLLLMTLFLMVSGLVMGFLGLLMLCIGVYFAIAWVILAQTHLAYQIYEIYLARGGEPIPLKAPPTLGAPITAEAI